MRHELVLAKAFEAWGKGRDKRGNGKVRFRLSRVNLCLAVLIVACVFCGRDPTSDVYGAKAKARYCSHGLTWRQPDPIQWPKPASPVQAPAPGECRIEKKKLGDEARRHKSRDDICMQIEWK
ncbi:hypothetical protein BC827DRAFT_1154040 [Russula dissimulans]|nr:hypothetical protein BC827DRAFT_1154040 [Russula dissimulans]